jgi:outer membrane receptor protein involved in Fe transport
MKRTLIACFAFLATMFLHAQVPNAPRKTGSQGDGLISGRVVNGSNDEVIEYASVKIYSYADSVLITGAYTDAQGRFTIENVSYGSFYGVIVAGGYRSKSIDGIQLSAAIKVANLGTIKLDTVGLSDLKEVKVTGQLDVLKAGIDKKIYNVGEDLSLKGGTANDILNNIPSVEVDQEGRVTLRGDGVVTVLIDGRPSSISGGNGKTLLDALPAGSIERIEVVTNPSAKYDPDGTSGIINIVLKKNKLRGMNGLFSVNAGSGDFTGGNVLDGTVSLSFRNARLNTFGSYSGRYLDGYRNNYSTLTQEFSNGAIQRIRQDRLGTDLNAGNTFRFGIDFYLKPRHALSIASTGSNGVRNRTGSQWNTFSDVLTDSVLFWNRYADDPSQQRNLDVNLNYRFDFKEDKGNLVFDVNQSFGRERIQGYYTQQYYTFDTVSLGGQALKQQLFNEEFNNITTAQLDITRLFAKINGRMEAGVKGILRKQGVDTYSEALDTLTGFYEEDTLANFLYKYDEQVFSMYGLFGQQLGKWKYQGGIRIEQAYQIPNLVSDSNRIVNDYFNFFPSAHLRYGLTEKSEIGLSYSRRINRASSADLNPFTSYADPYNLRRGNPYLQPEYIHSIDLGYSNEVKKVNFTTSVFYRQTSGVISRVKEFYADNTSAVTFANIDKSHSVGFEAVVIARLFPWWKNNFSVNANYTQYEDDNPNVNWNVGGFNWNMKYSGTFECWKKTLSIQINGTYNGPRVTVQGRAQRRGPLDISAEKTFKGGKISVGTRVSDVFNRQGFEMMIDQERVQQDAEFKWLTRRVYLTFSYKFGKVEFSGKKSSGGEGGGYDM